MKTKVKGQNKAFCSSPNDQQAWEPCGKAGFWVEEAKTSYIWQTKKSLRTWIVIFGEKFNTNPIISLNRLREPIGKDEFLGEEAKLLKKQPPKI